MTGLSGSCETLSFDTQGVPAVTHPARDALYGMHRSAQIGATRVNATSHQGRYAR
jgi:hypothetical protein